MKCVNCGIEVSKEFMFALKANQCPGCGKAIMRSDQMGAYLSLCELLKSVLQDADVEKISALIVANFELKQSFKVPENTVEAKTQTPVSVSVSAPDVSTQLPKNIPENKVVAESIMTEDGIRLEPRNDDNARAIMQKLRDEALKGAIDERYDIEVEDETNIVISDDPKTNAELLKQRQKFAEAQRKISQGGGGKNSFSRS
ncbi:MAG: hypothetical protein WC523_03740 [Patescibacteria group bacterium]